MKPSKITCPKCGHSFSQSISFNLRPLIRAEYQKLSKRLQRILNQTANLIIKTIPSENEPSKLLNFLKSLDKIDEEIIIKKCNEYYAGNYVYQGKGFNYLFAMINNYNKDLPALIQYEEMKFGKQPPLKE